MIGKRYLKTTKIHVKENHMTPNSQLIYDPIEPSEEVFKKAGYAEVPFSKPQNLLPGEYMKEDCQGGPYHTLLGVHKTVHRVYWRQH
jgi:hypothetical protein